MLRGHFGSGVGFLAYLSTAQSLHGRSNSYCKRDCNVTKRDRRARGQKKSMERGDLGWANDGGFAEVPRALEDDGDAVLGRGVVAGDDVAQKGEVHGVAILERRLDAAVFH